MKTLQKIKNVKFGTIVWTLAALPILPGALLLLGAGFGLDTLVRKYSGAEKPMSEIARLPHAA